MPHCTECPAKGCQKREMDRALDDCPCRLTGPEEAVARYTEEELRTAREAACVEKLGYCRDTRIEEIMHYALRCGYQKLGLAFCAGFRTEGATTAQILRANGFEVEAVICKNEGVDKSCIDTPEEALFTPGRFEAMCNPAGQAAALDAAGCQLHIVLGLCVGHDTLFFQHAKAPVTVLAVKDRAMGNNPLAAIYTAKSYTNRVFHWREEYEERYQKG